MRIRPLIMTAAVVAASAATAPLQAQSTPIGIAIVDNGFASRTDIEQGYCPTSPGCLVGRVFYWSCSGSSCTIVTPSTFSTHAGQVAKAAARTIRNHEAAGDPPVEFYSIVGNPEAAVAASRTRIRVVVNTLGTASDPAACATGAPPPLGVSVVRATGNQTRNGFAHPTLSAPFVQAQIDCRPGVTSVAGTLALPSLGPGRSVWVGDRNGLECTNLGDDNNPCSQYPFFVKSNFTPQTTFAAEGCLSTILAGSACTSGEFIGTSFSAAVPAGAYVALYRRSPALTPTQAESLLRDHTPETFFTINTIGSPFHGQSFGVRILTPATIQSALDSL
jgi:hypothetical protein